MSNMYKFGKETVLKIHVSNTYVDIYSRQNDFQRKNPRSFFMHRDNCKQDFHCSNNIESKS
jgi:hypothetical protein